MTYSRIEDGVEEIELQQERSSTFASKAIKLTSAAAVVAGMILLAQQTRGMGSTGPALSANVLETANEEDVFAAKSQVVGSDYPMWVAAQNRSDVQEMAKEKVFFAAKSQDDVKALYEQFKIDHSRSFTAEEDSERFTVFKKNLKFIDALNAQNPLALFGITESADRTEEERAMNRMSGKWTKYDEMKASLPDEVTEAAARGPEYVMGKTFKADSSDISKGEFAWASEDDCAACDLYPGLKNYKLDDMPDDFDWRELGAVTPVQNQKYCGSCWTFSTSGDIEGTHYLATGNLTKLSEQQFVACDVKNDGCDGGWMYAAMQYVSDFGVLVSQADYEYKGVMMDYDLPTPTCDTELLNSKLEKNAATSAHIEGYKFVAMGEEYEKLMALTLIKNGPLSLAINAAGMEYYVHGITGCETIFGSDYCQAGSIDTHTPCSPTELDHGVLAVAMGVQEGTKYWVIKNSWGTEWGEDGYYRIERGSDHCGVSNMVQHSVFKMA